MRNLLVAVVLVIGLAGWGVKSGFVSIHYPRIIENEPLRSPVQVVSVDGSRILLEDGRVIEFEDEPLKGTWESTMNDTDHRVDVESGGDGKVMVVYGNQKGWICGTPWAQPICLPLIAEDVYRNRRSILGHGIQQEKTPDQPKTVPADR